MFIDEVQDYNGIQRTLAHMFVEQSRNGIRVFGAGDDQQAIFMFTGVESNSLELTANKFNMKYHRFTESFRCPKEHVKIMNQWVSDIKSHESVLPGHVHHISSKDLMKYLKKDGLIYARSNRALVEVGLALFEADIDIRFTHTQLIDDLLQKIHFACEPHGGEKRVSYDRLPYILDEYMYENAASMQEENYPDHAVEKHYEYCTILKNAMKRIDANTVNQFKGKFRKALGESTHPFVTVSSIHKVKGQESRHCYIIGGDELPKTNSKKKQTEDEILLEKRLAYVAFSRSLEHLYIVTDEGSNWDMDEIKAKANGADTTKRSRLAELLESIDEDKLEKLLALVED
jgi:superfamily I DNA/RNA helicase